MVITKPEVAYVVSKVSQFMHRPTNRHWMVVKRIVRYLHGTITHGLVIRKSLDFTLYAYSDVDWTRCPDDRRSTTGYAVYIGGNLVS